MMTAEQKNRWVTLNVRIAKLAQILPDIDLSADSMTTGTVVMAEIEKAQDERDEILREIVGEDGLSGISERAGRCHG